MKEILNKLDSFSKRSAKFFGRQFSDWKRYFSVKPFDEFSEGGTLLVQVPVPAKGFRPIPDERDFLTISTDYSIIVSFDYYHEHFDIFTEEENFKNAADFIRSIINEEICSVAVFSEDKWLTTTKIKAGEKPDFAKLGAEFIYFYDSPKEIYVRSWRGTHNREYLI